MVVLGCHWACLGERARNGANDKRGLIKDGWLLLVLLRCSNELTWGRHQASLAPLSRFIFFCLASDCLSTIPCHSFRVLHAFSRGLRHCPGVCINVTEHCHLSRPKGGSAHSENEAWGVEAARAVAARGTLHARAIFNARRCWPSLGAAGVSMRQPLRPPHPLARHHHNHMA